MNDLDLNVETIILSDDVDTILGRIENILEKTTKTEDVNKFHTLQKLVLNAVRVLNGYADILADEYLHLTKLNK